MTILLTNDDGYRAPGILALYEELRSDHEVVLVAPDRERSAIGHAINLNEPIRYSRLSLNGGGCGYAVTGTPADCVKLALFEFFPQKPDLVISGINPGSNTGVNINYSGTVAAAREAALNGILSMAVSIRRGDVMDFEGVARLVRTIADNVSKKGLAPGTFLNINAPALPMDSVSGIQITRQASNNLSTRLERREDPRNKPYFWYGGMDPVSSEPETDSHAILNNCVSITPLRCDLTDYGSMAELAFIRSA